MNKDKEIMKNAPKTIDYLNEESKKHFEDVKKYLDALQIEYKVNTNLVRGLDYYSHTVFEVEASVEGFGSQNVLCGGGRYDNLVENIGGPSTKGVGFAMGIERLLTALEFENINLNEIFGDAIKGKTSGNIILKGLGKILGSELKESMKMVISILLIIVICGMLRSISENIGNNQTSKVGHFIQIIILITVLMKVYANILKSVKETLETISSFVYMLIPMFMSLSISTRQYYIINRNTINNINFNQYNNSIHKSNFNSSSDHSNCIRHNF